MRFRVRSVLACVFLMVGAPCGAQVDPLAPLPDRTPTVQRSIVLPQTRPILQPVTPVAVPLVSPTREMRFAVYKQQLTGRARRSGISEATIGSTIPWLSLNGRVIQLDRAQPGGPANSNATPPFGPYRREHLTASLISRGRAIYAANRAHLAVMQASTGVEAAVPVAIFGHETSYGSVLGNFDLLDALATLAFEGRRRELFESEFVAALKLLDRGTPRSRLRGSWAGATGYPQFMPSAVLRLATDGDGDGRADIWSNQADAFASISTFLKDAGWKPGVHWGVPVRTPAGLDRAALKNTVVAPRCAPVYARHSKWLTMREWRALGVVPTGQSLPDAEPASLLEPDGPNGTAYLLTANYRVILQYNCSNFYALSVGLLADAIAAP